MVRLIGGGYHEINDTDCGSSVTSVGGGDNQCGTDCDADIAGIAMAVPVDTVAKGHMVATAGVT